MKSVSDEKQYKGTLFSAKTKPGVPPPRISERYARSGLLRPCWYVALSLTVQLTGTETLTPQTRHSYLPEVLLIACCVDAVTGEVVQ